MSYASIKNLYVDQTILLLRLCFALEKVDGTSASISYRGGQVLLSSGGADRERFVDLFDKSDLLDAFRRMGHPVVVVHGEAYGGNEQAQAWRYGPHLRFVVFEVKVGSRWLEVPEAEMFAKRLGLEFVHYTKVPTDLIALDAERDAPSVQARRNGVAGDQPREGVVLRPLLEMTLSDGSRIMAKYKRQEESETATARDVVDPSRLQVLADANAIATEWCTPRRLLHVLAQVRKAGVAPGLKDMRVVIATMIDDVMREGASEIVDSLDARHAISKRTAELFLAHLKATAGET